ncbi:MAG: hypothetical protein AB7Y46_13905 [Armatimonadota bacterium]
MLSLTGGPAQVGAIWGRLNGAAIREQCEQFVRTLNEQGVGHDELLRRAARAAGIIDQVAPHWREEADAVAAAAGLDPELHLAYHIGKYRGLLALQLECTSYAAGGAATASGCTLFHKSRDNVPRPQVAYVKRIPGVRAFVTLSDTSDLGCMMMVNDAGLAGSADTGAPDDGPFGQGLMNPWGLRHIAERAATCEQALAILREWTGKRWYAGGRRATNWMFADAAGHILRVVNYNDRLEVQWQRDGYLLNCERAGLREFMEARSGALDDDAFMTAARLPGVCFDSTISALTVEIDADAPARSIAWVCVGRPGRLPFVPLALAAERVPVALLDGSLSRPPAEPGLPAEEVAALEARFRARVEACPQGDTAALEQVAAICVREALDALRGQQ